MRHGSSRGGAIRGGTHSFRRRVLAAAAGAFGAALVLSSILLCAAACASTVEPPPYYASFGPDGTAASEFGVAKAIAVDQTDDLVYVLDTQNQSIYRFDHEGHPVAFTGSATYLSGNMITGLASEACAGCSQIAVSPVTHDIYVTSGNAVTAFHADGEEADFTAGPGAGTNKIGGFSELLGVAVDKTGSIYASDYVTNLVKIYDPTGAPVTQFEVHSINASGKPGNLAVDGKGAVYVNIWSGPIEKYNPASPGLPVSASTTYVAPADPFDDHVDHTVSINPANNDVYVAADNAIRWYDESGAELATFATGEEANAVSNSQGVAVFSEEEEVFASTIPDVGPSQIEVFWERVVAGPPLVKKVSVADVSADSATLRALVNPSRAETTYRFEYGTEDCAASACESVPVGGSKLSSGHRYVAVSKQIHGLQPDTVYHYRLVAENEFGDNVAAEEDHTFATQTAALGSPLPDARAWEMVSPPNKHGALVIGPFPLVQAAANGQSVVYPTVGSIEEDPEGNRSFEPAIVRSLRTSGNWVSSDLMPPNDEVDAASGAEQYKLFSSDLASALLAPPASGPLAPGSYKGTPYLRTNTAPPAYEPLVTEGDVPAGTEGGEFSIVGVSRDLSHVVLTSTVPLADNAPPAGAYVWSGGELRPLSVLPLSEGGGIVAPSVVGSGVSSQRGAISDDGSRVFWSPGLSIKTTGTESTGLYVRDTVAEETARLDVAAGGSEEGVVRPIFQGASSDGSVVFFTDSEQLTANAGASGSDLYRCEIAPGALVPGPGGSACSSLVDLTAQTVNAGESAEVHGIATGVAEEGNAIYFVAHGVLDDVPSAAGESASPGALNLYAWRQGEGVRFIAALASADFGDWGATSDNRVPNESQLTAHNSPNGRYLSFMSQRSLTGANNLDAFSGEPVEEVYRYDSSADRLDCISCKATSAAPEGESIPAHDDRPGIDPNALFANARVAAALPQWQTNGADLTFYGPRATLDNGRVFFNSIDSLVPAASNGQWNVYQYEPTGVGSCTTASKDARTARAAGGCVSLISSGSGEEEDGFLDASESGNDVFFVTSSQLNETDEDQEFDVYDARVDGTPATLPSISECLGEACQPAPQPPSDATPASANFKGSGNVKPQANCRSFSKRAQKLRRSADSLRRHAAAAGSETAARHLRSRAEHLNRKAKHLDERARNCKGSNPRSSR